MSYAGSSAEVTSEFSEPKIFLNGICTTQGVLRTSIFDRGSGSKRALTHVHGALMIPIFKRHSPVCEHNLIRPTLIMGFTEVVPRACTVFSLSHTDEADDGELRMLRVWVHKGPRWASG